MDTVDLFYKINDHKWNGNGTYVFKSSQTAAEIGLLMDKSARNTQFKDVVAHMDGLHLWAKGLITLTLWVTNPLSLITHHFACMDCESKNTENVALFLKLFNEILRKVKKDPTLIWSPRGIMVDENGTNKNAIRQVLGDEMAKRSWGCQWHYFQCTKHQSMKIKACDRKEFLNLAYALAKDVVTKNKYFDILTKLKEMCTTNSCMKWLKFWRERCEHFVPACHGFFLPGMNIAESVQSGMHAQQPHGKMLSLVGATYKDISKQMCQDAMFKVDARNQPVEMWKSQNLLDLQLYARSEQEKCAPILAWNLVEGNQWLEESALENDTTRERNFLPPENSSHKFIDSEEEENLILKDNPNERHNPSQQKSNTKRPLEGTKCNAKKSIKHSSLLRKNQVHRELKLI